MRRPTWPRTIMWSKSSRTPPGGGEVIFRVCVKTNSGPLYTINARNEKMASVDDFPISKTCRVRRAAVGLDANPENDLTPTGGCLCKVVEVAPWDIPILGHLGQRASQRLNHNSAPPHEDGHTGCGLRLLLG